METQIQPNVSPLPAPAEMMSAEDLVAWALDRWHPRIAVCTSFQAEGMVILDLCWRYRKDVRVMTIDTGRLPAETYEMMDRIRDHYGIRPEVFFPHAESVETMVQESGVNLFYRSREERKRCCRVRKVEPLARMLQPLDAWMVGLRRDQSSSRAGVCKLETDWEQGSKIKLSPLADWTHDQVWSYLRRNRVPYHPLYDQGYGSIGCAPCSRALRPGEHPRAGRWWWEQGSARECGIHCFQKTD